MRSTLIALMLTAGLSAASLAAELQPKTIELLIKLGYDPKSPTITQVAGEKIGNVSLDSLAADGDRTMMKRFIVTRNFVREYKVNPDLPWPSPLDYSDAYFTAEETDFFVARNTQRLCAAQKIPSGKRPPGTLLPCP